MEQTPPGNKGIALQPIIFGTSALGNLYQAITSEKKSIFTVQEMRSGYSPP